MTGETIGGLPKAQTTETPSQEETTRMVEEVETDPSEVEMDPSEEGMDPLEEEMDPIGEEMDTIGEMDPTEETDRMGEGTILSAGMTETLLPTETPTKTTEEEASFQPRQWLLSSEST